MFICSPSQDGGKGGRLFQRREFGECRLFFLAQSHHVTHFGAILSRFGLVDRSVVLTSQPCLLAALLHRDLKLKKYVCDKKSSFFLVSKSHIFGLAERMDSPVNWRASLLQNTALQINLKFKQSVKGCLYFHRITGSAPFCNCALT